MKARSGPPTPPGCRHADTLRAPAPPAWIESGGAHREGGQAARCHRSGARGDRTARARRAGRRRGGAADQLSIRRARRPAPLSERKSTQAAWPWSAEHESRSGAREPAGPLAEIWRSRGRSTPRGVDRVAASRAEGMGRHVVVQEVDVDRRAARVDIARYRQSERAPAPTPREMPTWSWSHRQCRNSPRRCAEASAHRRARSRACPATRLFSATQPITTPPVRKRREPSGASGGSAARS